MCSGVIIISGCGINGFPYFYVYLDLVVHHTFVFVNFDFGCKDLLLSVEEVLCIGMRIETD